MKTITVFETIDELIDAFQPNRPEGVLYPLLPPDIKLRHQENGLLYFFGTGSIYFSIEELYWNDLVNEVMQRQGIRVQK